MIVKKKCVNQLNYVLNALNPDGLWELLSLLTLHLPAPGSTDCHKLDFSEPKNALLSALRAEKLSASCFVGAGCPNFLTRWSPATLKQIQHHEVQKAEREERQIGIAYHLEIAPSHLEVGASWQT